MLPFGHELILKYKATNVFTGRRPQLDLAAISESLYSIADWFGRKD
jgi:hypothetical protein